MGEPVGHKSSHVVTLHTDASVQLFLETWTRHDVTASRRAGFSSSVYDKFASVNFQKPRFGSPQTVFDV